MTSPSTPSEPVSPTGAPGPARSGPPAAAPSDASFRAFVRAPFRALRKRADPRKAAAAASTLFHPGEVEYARLRSLPPFDTDVLILTDRRLMRVRTDGSGAVAQLSQAAPWQVESARAEDFRDHASVTIELHIGATMRLEETTPVEAQRFVAILTEVAERSRS